MLYFIPQQQHREREPNYTGLLQLQIVSRPVLFE